MTSETKIRKQKTNLNIRVTSQQKQVIARAAQLKQTTIKNFVLASVLEAAQNIVSEQRHFTLSAAKWKAFCYALKASPRNHSRLRKLLTEASVFDKE